MGEWISRFLLVILAYSVLNSFFLYVARFYYKRGYNKGHTEASESATRTEYLRESSNRLMQDQQIDEFVAKTLLGKVIVAIPNEWQDPCFIKAEDYKLANDKHGTMVLGKNLLTGQDSQVWLCNSLLVDEKLLEALLKLTPFERWNLVSGKDMKNNIWSKVYPNDDSKVSTPDFIRNKVLPILN